MVGQSTMFGRLDGNGGHLSPEARGLPKFPGDFKIGEFLVRCARPPKGTMVYQKVPKRRRKRRLQ